MSNSYRIGGLGWLPDPPSVKDYGIGAKNVEKFFSEDIKTAIFSEKNPPPSKMNLEKWCSPIEDQGELGSCCAHAGVALVEYFERKSFDKHLDASRLFLYKVARNLLTWQGDRGAFIRTVMGAITLFGIPPEEYWPYNGAPAENNPDYDREPTAFCYSFAQNYQAIKYLRLDQSYNSTKELLDRIKRFLAQEFPLIFGFTVFDNFTKESKNDKIPYPGKNDRVIGGHAVMAVGYDDTIKIKNISGEETKGAIYIRNSWGEKWGSKGYGWLPYDYILNGMAVDWWTITKKEWIDTKQFD